MEMIMGEREVDMGGQRLYTKDVSGLVLHMFQCGVKDIGN